MTENTKTLSIRLSNEDKAELQKYLNRESAEALLRQIKRGEIDLTLKGAIFKGVNTKSESVNTETNDPDGEWVREMAHELNMDVRTFKRKVELGIRL